MEIATDERFFTEEWFIDNITCWNFKIHGKAIVHKNVIVDQLNFRLELYPNGQNGDEEHLVVVVYDENRSDGELSFISSDGSVLWELVVKDLDWNECYAILPTVIKFDDIVKHIARKPFHVDCLTLRYQKRKSFDVIFRVRNEIDVIDTSIEIPTTQLDTLPWTSKCQSIVNFLIDGKLATLQFIASTTAGSDGGLIHFEFMLLNMVKNSSSPNYFLMRSCVYLLNGEGDSLAFEENEHVFLNLRNWNFSYLRSGGEKGLSLLIRLKFVTGSKRDNYTSCWFQPQQMNISLTNGLATSVPQDLSAPSEYTLDFSVNKPSENTINSSTPQAMHQFAITKASESTTGEIFTQNDVVTEQVGAAKSVPTDFLRENSSENTNDVNTPKTDQQFYNTKASEFVPGEIFTQSDVVTEQVGATKSVPRDFSRENSSENTNDVNTPKTDQQFYNTKASEFVPGEIFTQSDVVTDQVGTAKPVPTDFSKENYSENTSSPKIAQQQFNITKPVTTSVLAELPSQKHSDDTHGANTTLIDQQFYIKNPDDPSEENFSQSVKDDTTDQFGNATSVCNDFSLENSSENTNEPMTIRSEQKIEITKSEELSGENFTQSTTDVFTDKVEHAEGGFSPPENTNDPKDTSVEQHTEPDDLSGKVLTQCDVTDQIGAAKSYPTDFSKENSPENTNDSKYTSAEQQFDHTEPDDLSGKVLTQCDVTDQVGAAKSYPTDFSKENSPENTNDPKDTSAEQQFNHTEPDDLSGKVLTQCEVADQVGAAKSYPTDISKENFPENTNDSKDTLAEQQFDLTEPDDLSDGEDFPRTLQVVAADGTVYTIFESELHVNETGHGAAVNYWPEKFYEKNTEDSVTAMKVLLTVFNKELSNEIPFADFQLSCGNTVFCVHREVLGCHSKVFRPLLSKESGDSMELPDFDLRTFCQFVFYLYSLDAEGMPWEVALKLYRAAKRYKVFSLKRKCSTILCTNVSVSNVCEILLLADQYHDKMLLQVVHEFILSNYNDVLNSKEWKCLKDSNGPLLCKTLSNLADKVMLEKIKCFADFE